MRQIYTSLLAILRKDKPRHVLTDSVSEENFAKCDNYYRYFADCRHYLLWNTKECNGTLQLNMEYSYLVGHLGNFIRLVQQLRGKPDSWFLIGIGYHDKLDADLVIQAVSK
ncbi:unnamed protein product [Lymnaea stagnalis]|uniref:Uncharacterized protein n=1 Tax=Lymnaea stagnalis TaxID=6523 RepID=A0AAV2I4C2_LYMST